MGRRARTKSERRSASPSTSNGRARSPSTPRVAAIRDRGKGGVLAPALHKIFGQLIESPLPFQPVSSMDLCDGDGLLVQAIESIHLVGLTVHSQKVPVLDRRARHAVP